MALIEPMSVVALGIARELNTVATEVLRPADGVVEQLPTHSAAAMVGDDMHRFDFGAATTAVLKVAEREQLEHADDSPAELGDEKIGPVGPIDLAECVDVVVDVCGVVGTRSDATTEQDVDEVFDVTVERIAEVQLHGS